MKNIFCFMVALLVIFARPSATALPLFNGDGSLTEGSKYLCQILEIDDKVTNAQQFTEFFQTNFGGNTEAESREKCASIIKSDENTPEKLFEKLSRACELLGMKQAILPQKEKYDYVMIFGSTTNAMTEICQFIRNEMASIIGNNPDTKIVFVTSQRPLAPKSESVEIERLKDRNLPQTEICAAQLIWEQELGEYSFSCEFVDGKQKMKTQEQNIIGNLSRSPGAMVIVSCNPFIALLGNRIRSTLILTHRWFEFGGTLENVGCTEVIHYDEIINNAKDQKIKHKAYREAIWLYIDIITNCAFEEFWALEESKQLVEEGK
ncbi:MAG: hypothetical protein LBJ75_00040 [Puniceicoccales bacterium]|jgi:hypothetical protein|nr:hypothetical protein [Puniceicoccales bacterium]